MIERPENFVLKYDHALARGLVFAGLGNGCVGSSRYIDSSTHKNHCILTNMDPKTDWVWIPELGRWGLDFAGGSTNENAPFSKSFLPSTSWTILLWLYPRIASGQDIFRFANSARMQYYRYIHLTTDEGLSSGGINWLPIPSATNVWSHGVIVAESNTFFTYANGNFVETQTRTNGIDIENIRGITATWVEFNFIAVDIMIYNRVLNLGEIQQFADPSNIMLSNMIKPPKRKLYPMTYHPTTERFLIFKQNNKFLSFTRR